MAKCLISFGANLGQPAETIRRAAREIQSMLAQALTGFTMSRMFRTPAVGGPTGQPPFVNSVAALELHDRSAWDVWHVVREVELRLGRVRQERWEARRIDLDVLLFDDQRIWTQHFKLPHPRMIMRRFILEPALDVASDWIEPVSQMTLNQLAANLRYAPASLLLISSQPQHDQKLMEDAASQSRCQWLVPCLSPAQSSAYPSASWDSSTSQLQPSPDETWMPGKFPEDPGTRWLGVLPIDQLPGHAASRCVVCPQPRVSFVLAPATDTPGAAWEDIHRPLARWMGLCGEEKGDASTSLHHHWPISGPRYLLSTDDRKWSEHEIVAALDAMDCPVESSSSS